MIEIEIEKKKIDQGIKCDIPFFDTVIANRFAVSYNRYGNFHTLDENCKQKDVLGVLLQSYQELSSSMENIIKKEFKILQKNYPQKFFPQAKIGKISFTGDPHPTSITARIEVSTGDCFFRKIESDALRSALKIGSEVIGIDCPIAKQWPVAGSRSVWEEEVNYEPEIGVEDFLHSYAQVLALTSWSGLSDLHHENFILGKNGLQIIDTEVYNPGRFLLPNDMSGSEMLVEAFGALLPTATGMLPDRVQHRLFSQGNSPIEVPDHNSYVIVYDKNSNKFLSKNIDSTPNSKNHLPSSLSLNKDSGFRYDLYGIYASAMEKLSKEAPPQKILRMIAGEDSKARRLIRHTKSYHALVNTAYSIPGENQYAYIFDALNRNRGSVPESIVRQEADSLALGRIPKFEYNFSTGLLSYEGDEEYEKLDYDAIKDPMHSAILSILSREDLCSKWVVGSKKIVSHIFDIYPSKNALPAIPRKRKMQCGSNNSNMIEKAKMIIDHDINSDQFSCKEDRSKTWVTLSVNSNEEITVGKVGTDLYSGIFGMYTVHDNSITKEECDGTSRLKFYSKVKNDPKIGYGYYQGKLGALRSVRPFLEGKEYLKELSQLGILALDSAKERKDLFDLISGLCGVSIAFSRSSIFCNKNIEERIHQLIQRKFLSLSKDELENEYGIVKGISFAHGYSGIIAALSSYAIKWGLEDKTKIALQRLLELDQYFICEGKMVDPRFDGSVRSFHWCNGAIGGIVARVLARKVGDKDIARIATTQMKQDYDDLEEYSLSLGHNSVCHGLSGVILLLEFIEEEFPALSKKRLLYQAREELVARVVEEQDEKGFVSYSKGLMTGSAGISAVLAGKSYRSVLIPEV